MKTKNVSIVLTMAIFCLFSLAFTQKAFPHCDTMDGPVLTSAKEALKTGNVNLVLMWIQKDDEKEIKALFEKTMKLRKQGGEVQELADMYFFENFVRIHRAGEGAPYTGLKPAGDVEESIAAADKAVESGSIDNVMKMLDETVKKGVAQRFKELMEKKNYDKNKPEEGREFVEKYVVFIHYVEGIFNSAEISSCCQSHNKSESSGTCNHEQKNEPASIEKNETEKCTNNTGSCANHALPIILIATILNLIMLIFVLFKIKKIK